MLRTRNIEIELTITTYNYLCRFEEICGYTKSEIIEHTMKNNLETFFIEHPELRKQKLEKNNREED